MIGKNVSKDDCRKWEYSEMGRTHHLVPISTISIVVNIFTSIDP